MANKLIDQKYTKWIASNLLFNYGLWDDQQLFIESFYINNDINLGIDLQNYALMILGVNKKYNRSNAREHIHTSMENHFEWIKKTKDYALSVGVSICTMLIKVDNSKQILILLSKSQSCSISLAECATEICRKTKADTALNYGLTPYFACSYTEGYSGYEDLNKAYIQARYLNDLIFFMPNNSFLTAQTVQLNYENFDQHLFYNSCHKWKNIIYYHTLDNALIYTKELFYRIKTSYNFKFFEYFIDLIEDTLAIMCSAHKITITNYQSKMNFFSIDEYTEYYHQLIKQVLSKISHKLSINCTQAVYYIHQNYHSQNLNLQEVADFIGIHNAYLSSEFKKELKASMVQYIHDYRIQQAMNLLTTTDLSINEIARRTGYVDDDLFRKYFKKFNGQTAYDFRMGQKRKPV